jgi:two-component system response regulator AtoC
MMVSDAQDLVAHISLSVTPPEGGDNFIAGTSQAILALENVIAGIARTNIPVLLVGESGTGKEMFARRIHLLSLRSKEPLVRIACASMNAAAFSAELGLHPSGKRNVAPNAVGTLLLDEINELDHACQRSLLCALPDSDAKPRLGLLAARVISTTSRNLDAEIREGRFRNELYYRINGVSLRLPPLRERKEDIPLLAEFFLAKHAAQFGRISSKLSARTLEVFMEHPWPGNIRELENVVRKILALNDEHLAVAELIQSRSETSPAAPETRACPLKAAARAASREAERELILKALARTRWNRKRAAQDLQISYKSLLYKLKQIGLRDTEANQYLR